MIDVALGVVGILLSLFLFLVGYRQTVGAKKERIAACNQQLEKILVRRIVLEAHVPQALDVARLIEGKARDFRVRGTDILSVAQTLNIVYTRIMESDVIPGEERQKIIERIVPALQECEAPEEDLPEDRGPCGLHRLSGTTVALATMAVLASLVGALVPALPDLGNLSLTNPGLIKAFLLTAASSLGAIAGLAVFFRIRASQEIVPTRGTEVDQSVRLNEEVAATLRRLRASFDPIPPGRPGDLFVEFDGRKYLIEVKAWPNHRVPAALVRGVSERLKRTADQIGAHETLIVTLFPVVGPAASSAVAGVRLLTLSQLGSYFARRKEGTDAA